MSKRKLPLWQSLVALASMGAIVIVLLIAIEIAVFIVSGIVGIVVAMFHGWGPGLLAAVVSCLLINKILWYCEIFEMVSSGSPKKRAAKANSPPGDDNSTSQMDADAGTPEKDSR